MKTLTKTQREDLSAWLDGELPAPRADEVANLVASDPAWKQAHAELTRLDGLLDAWQAPAMPVDLPDRILDRAHRPNVLRIARWLAPAAAAAMLAVAGLAVYRAQTPSPQATTNDVARQNETIPESFIAENVELFAPPATLAERVRTVTGESLADKLTSGKRWDHMNDAEQADAREKALAFLKLTPAEQQQRLAHYEAALQNDPEALEAWRQRAQWLKVILRTLEDEQRDALKTMTPAQRANLFLQKKNELRDNGLID